MDLENIKESTKDAIIQNFMENVKHARRGASHQRPKSWSKGTKSGSDKRKMREEGKRDAREMNEEASDAEKDAKLSGYRNAQQARADNWGMPRNPNGNLSGQDREIARMNTNSKWAMERLMPVYEKHGMAEEHAGTTDEYGFPQSAHAVTHPNFKGFVADFIAFHTTENKRHWAEKNKASSYHWPAILRARRALQTHEELAKKNPGDLSESLYASLRKRLAEASPVMGWHEGDPELEGDDIAKIEASLSPEERDPFHLVSHEEREDMHQTLESDPDQGSHLVRAGVLGRISSIANMAADTKSYGDDPKAMTRIGQLIDYANKAITQKRKDISVGDGKDIPTGRLTEYYMNNVKPNLFDISSRTPQNRLQQQINSMNSVGFYSDKGGQLPPHLIALNRISGWTHRGMDTEPTPRATGKSLEIASNVMYGQPKPFKELMGLDPETIVPPEAQRTATTNEKATEQAASQTTPGSSQFERAMQQGLEQAARIRKGQSPPPG